MEINWERRMIFGGIVFFILLFLTFYTHSQSTFNAFPHLWIIPSWILWIFVISFTLAFIDFVFFAVILYLLFSFLGDFLFVGIYHVNWLFLLRSFIPHTGNIAIKAMVYGFYAFVVVLLLLPILIRRRLHPYRKKSKWAIYTLMVVGILILASVILHFSSLIESFLFPLLQSLWTPNIVVDAVVYVVIGVVVLCAVWYLLFDEIFIFEFFTQRAFDRKFKEWEKQDGERRARQQEQRDRQEEKAKEEKRENNPPFLAKDDTGFAYSILGLTPSASSAEVRKAYRNKVMQYHPDRTHKNTNATMQGINAAYELIRKQRGMAR